jgi:hypothetical protein
VSRRSHPWRLLAGVAAGAAAVVALLCGTGHVYRTSRPFERVQDPRRQLLWDADPGRYRVLIIGDSAFASPFVNWRRDMLAQQLGRRLGTPVFAGAMNGIHPQDFIAESEYLARHLRPGAVVFLDFEVGRLFRIGHTPEDWDRSIRSVRPGGFSGSADPGPRGGHAPIDALDRALHSVLERRLHLVAMQRAWSEATNRQLNPRGAAFNLEDIRELRANHRVWFADDGQAKYRMEDFVGRVRLDRAGPPLDWVYACRDNLARAGARLVVVVTPWSEDVARAYGPPEWAAEFRREVDTRAAAAAAAMRARGVEVLDLQRALPSECFADLLHTNTCGDALLAERLSEARSQKPEANSR